MGNSGVGGFVATGEVTTKFLIRPSILSKRRTLALNYRYVFVQSQSSYSDRGGAEPTGGVRVVGNSTRKLR